MPLAAEPCWDKAAYSWGAFSGKRDTSTCVHLGLGPGAEPEPLRDKISIDFETVVPRQHRRGPASFEPTHEFCMRPKAHVLSH